MRALIPGDIGNSSCQEGVMMLILTTPCHPHLEMTSARSNSCRPVRQPANRVLMRHANEERHGAMRREPPCSFSADPDRI